MKKNQVIFVKLKKKIVQLMLKNQQMGLTVD